MITMRKKYWSIILFQMFSEKLLKIKKINKLNSEFHLIKDAWNLILRLTTRLSPKNQSQSNILVSHVLLAKWSEFETTFSHLVDNQ